MRLIFSINGRKFLKSVFLGKGILLVLAILSTTSANAERKEPPRWEDQKYEDLSTFKNGRTYIVDPYVWVYNQKFADLYRMPEQWIDDNLKGALAVAFRMTTVGNLTCGYGGREDNCWPPLNCQLDVYYDNNIKLPWVREDIVRDFMMPGVSSFSHLVPVDPRVVRRYVPSDPNAPRGVMASDGVIKVGKFQSGGAQIAYFDREFQPGIGLIAWIGTGVCPKPVGVGHMYFYDLRTAAKISHKQIKPEKAKPMHVIEFPESFMRRANVVYEAQNKLNKEISEGLIKQFFKSRQLPMKP